MPDRYYINAEVNDPRPNAPPLPNADTHPIDRAVALRGNKIWLKAGVKRGKKVAPPRVVWYATRTANDDDGFYLEDPEFVVPDPAPDANERWACIKLPSVTGVTWAFKAVRSKEGKPDKSFPAGSIITWKRVFFNVNADTEALYTLWKTAFPMIKASFEPGFIEVVQNLVTVGARKEQKTDKSLRNGFKLGEIYTVELHEPATDKVGFPLSIPIANGATTCGNFAAIGGNNLTITVGPKSTLDARPVTKVIVKMGEEKIVELNEGGGNLDGVNGNHPLVVAAIDLVCNRVDDRNLQIRFDAPPMANRWNAAAQTWSTRRATSVVEAMGRGPIEVELSLGYKSKGSNGGDTQIGNRLRCFIDTDATEMATTIIHELGHGMNLVKEFAVRKYDDQRLNHDSHTPRRPPGARQEINGDYYPGTWGGSGTHCHAMGREITSCITKAKRSYEYNPASAGSLCPMFHATDARRRQVFCATCLKQLRGR